VTPSSEEWKTYPLAVDREIVYFLATRDLTKSIDLNPDDPPIGIETIRIVWRATMIWPSGISLRRLHVDQNFIFVQPLVWQGSAT
jgi:hypothetical protein